MGEHVRIPQVIPLVVAAIVLLLASAVRPAAQADAAAYAREIDAIRLLHDSPEFRTSVDRARLLLATVQKDPAASPMTIASVLDVLVESLSRVERTGDEILGHARRAVDIKMQAAGADDHRTAYSQMNLAGVLSARREFAEAQTLLYKAVAVFERTGNDDLLGRALVNLTYVVRWSGDLRTARTLGERAVAAAERAHGPDDVAVARALLNLSSVIDAQGDIRTSSQVSERATVIFRKHYQGDHETLALTLGDLAWSMDRANEFEKSARLHEESVAMYERTAGMDSPDLAWELNNYGLLFWRLGDYEAGRPLFERALAIWTRAKSPDASRAMNNLAITYRRLGDPARARQFYEASLALKTKTVGPDHPDVALVLFNAANLLREMGDYTTAQPMYERALRIREARLGPSHSLTAYAVNGLSLVLNDQGDTGRARTLAERAVAIWRDNKVIDLAIGLTTLGDISVSDGDVRAALRYYDEARAIYEKAYGPNHVDVAALLNNSGSMQARLGQFEAADRDYSRALAILERQFDGNHPSIAEVTAGLANVRWQTGDAKGALALAVRSERISREHFRLASRTLSEREAVSFLEKRAPALDVLMTVAASGELSPEDQRTVMDAAIRSRALVLDEVTARSRAVGGSQKVDPALVSAVARARQKLANLIVRGPRQGETGYAALVDAARAGREAAERALATASLEARDRLSQEHAGLDAVAGALPADTAILTFITYNNLTRAPRANHARSGDRRYAALILDGSRNVSIVPLGRAAVIDAQVGRWRNVMTHAASLPSPATYRQVAGALAGTIWRPVASRLAHLRQVFIVPDGALNLVSFAALPDVRTGRYLVENNTLIHYLSAERDLVARSAGREASSGLLALGNPSYTRANAVATARTKPEDAVRGAICPEFQRVQFARLPAVEREVRDLIAIWNAQSGAPVDRLSGDQATEAAFRQAARGRRILHLATHGFFLGACQPAGTVTRGVGGLAARKAASRAVTQPSIPLAGLAFAGANQRGSAGSEEDDGILTAEEVAGLDLHGVEWAVLSACDTGLGQVQAGEGVFGLRRAFATAGVATTIMSMWSVDDESTREWMGALYRARLVDGRSTGESVRDAMRAVLQARRAHRLSDHPFFWGAFVAAGDWR
jgi:CHAT domain-containing protein/tetratricopeptide (TPR) repeat protein